MSVYKKLMKARIELQSRKLSKSGHNKFAGYQYFELGDFIPSVQEIFAKLDLCGVVSFGKDIATLTIVDMGDDGGSIDITSPMSTAALKGCHEVQNLGAVQTYIRRYLWVTALEIVEHDALDSAKPENKPDVMSILKNISASRNVELLKTNVEVALMMLDDAHHEAVKKAKVTRYRELTTKEK